MAPLTWKKLDIGIHRSITRTTVKHSSFRKNVQGILMCSELSNSILIVTRDDNVININNRAMQRCSQPIPCSAFNNDGSIFAYACYQYWITENIGDPKILDKVITDTILGYMPTVACGGVAFLVVMVSVRCTFLSPHYLRMTVLVMMIGSKGAENHNPATAKNYIYLHLPQESEVKGKPRAGATGRK
ncbi:hypothetical protein V8G54_014473 [Vigna mungo]|uniref:Uncharacterized protein n=1 Tax=Vigna mungo TaxID=3915 RepID=A0AAQ3NJE5_VIGMU